jgi:hypothetical protein
MGDETLSEFWFFQILTRGSSRARNPGLRDLIPSGWGRAVLGMGKGDVGDFDD